MNRLVPLAAALLSLYAPSAFAQGRPDIPAAYAGADSIVIAACDIDRSFETSRAEMVQCLNEMFQAGDTDRSRALSYLELEALRMRAWGTNALPPYRLEFDRDQSMTITSEEFQAAWLARFAALDPRSTGIVTRAQLYRDMPRPDFSGMRRPPGGARPGGPGGGGPGGGSGRPPF